MKNRIYISLGGKGGVGKSVAVILFADFLVKNQIPFLAYDCDSENSGKASSFSTAYAEAAKVNLRSVADCDRLITEAAEYPITLVDLPANASADFHEWFEAVAKPETLEALNLEIIGLGCVTPEQGTFASVATWASKLQDSMRYIVVLNDRAQQKVALPREQLFPEYFNSSTGKQFREAFKPTEIQISGLYSGSMVQLAKSGLLPSLAVAHSAIPLLDRSRIHTWTSKVHEQLKGELL